MSSTPQPTDPGRTTMCPACGDVVQPFDRFCSRCGADIAKAGGSSSGTAANRAGEAFVPVPEAAISSSSHSTLSGDKTLRRRRRRKAWFKRPILIIPLVLLLLLGSAAGVALYRTMSAFDAVTSQSTPPPEISGADLGGDESVVIDTGPAQRALAERRTQAADTSEPTDASGSSGTEVPTVGRTQTSGDQRTSGSEPTESPDSISEVRDSSTSTTDATKASDAVTNPRQPADSPSSTQAAGTASGDNGNHSSVSTPLPPLPDDGVNILLMGVDARPGEPIDSKVRSDSLAVLHLDEATGSCRILAIPRDSRVSMPGYGNTKINHALAVGGIPFEQLVVEDYLGISIDHYALIDFSGVEQVVDALGGVTVDNPQAFDMGGQHFEAGMIELNGEQALLYSRYRGGDDGDFGRVSKQQQVLRALLNKAAALDLVRMVPQLFSLLSDHFRSDLGPTDLIGLANDYRSSCTAESLETRTIQGEVGTYPDDMMKMELSFVVSAPEVVRKDVVWLLSGE